MTENRAIPTVVEQHVDVAGSLHRTRRLLAKSGAVRLEQLHDVDERIDAHIDGLTVAGEIGWTLSQQCFGEGDFDAQFPACALAIESRNPIRLSRCFALAEAVPGTFAVMLDAFEWVSRSFLEGTVVTLLGQSSPTLRAMALRVCALHRVDPGNVSRPQLDSQADIRSAALRMYGEVGLVECDAFCRAALEDDDAECRFWAARSGVLLGNRGIALQALADAGLVEGPLREDAFTLALQTMTASAAHSMLQALGRDPGNLRRLIQGSGVSGDPAYVPWLIGHMVNNRFARVAGEAFTLITGADFAGSGLEQSRPEDYETGPSDYPDDTDVDMDSDDDLSWPHRDSVASWWAKNSHRFQPGTRYFMGQPVTRAHCIDVLKNGYQRQRILAAHYLCLLDPGTPLFNTSAPAWRQQKLLASMK
jgi:uncharacterized protein (TIGR02270 family)